MKVIKEQVTVGKGDFYMSKKSEMALQCFSEGFSCSQAVFTAYCEDLGLDKETGLKISGAFGGGMGHLNISKND